MSAPFRGYCEHPSIILSVQGYTVFAEVGSGLSSLKGSLLTHSRVCLYLERTHDSASPRDSGPGSGCWEMPPDGQPGMDGPRDAFLKTPWSPLRGALPSGLLCPGSSLPRHTAALGGGQAALHPRTTARFSRALPAGSS